MKTVIDQAALVELLREALENKGAMEYDAVAPVVPNAVVDRPSIQLDVNPVDIKHLPRTKNEMIVMVRSLLDNVDDDQSGELYSKIKDLVSKRETQVVTSPQSTGNQGIATMENKRISDMVMTIVEAELGKSRRSKPSDEEEIEVDAEEDVWDADKEADEEEAEEEKQKKGRGEIGAYGVDGETLEKIGEEMGFTKEAAKKAVETAMERFKALYTMDDAERGELVLTGISDYIDFLATSGEMSAEEESFMRLHPKVVAASDSFRDFFSKYVKRATRSMRADSQDDE